MHLILGPPGTGKTRRVTDAVLDCADRLRIPPEEIQVATFTRSARAEVRERLLRERGWGEDRLPWVRTIHSAAHRLVGRPEGGYFSAREHGREFERVTGFRLRMRGAASAESLLDDTGAIFSETAAGYRVGADERIRAAYEWGRARRIPESRIPTEWPSEEPLDAPRFHEFARAYRQFKAERGLSDFADLLDAAMISADAGIRPPVRAVIVDEAQDLSSAQVALVERWARGVETFIIVGDEDQAIYAPWSGADVSWLLARAAESRPEILSQSHRIPRQVQAVAGPIIRRNLRRVPKLWRPRPGDGEVLRCSSAAEGAEVAARRAAAGETAFALFRNRAFIASAAERLRLAGLPYVIEGAAAGAPNPLGVEATGWSGRKITLLEAVRLAADLAAGEPVDGQNLAAAIQAFVRAEGILDRGTKTILKEVSGRVTPDDAEQLGLGAWLDRARTAGPVHCYDMAVSPADLAYVDGLMTRSGGRLPEAVCVLTTCHQAKGREADVVAVSPDMTRATWEAYRRDPEPENRVYYVAVTRARRTLILCGAESDMAFEWPSAAETGEVA